MSDLKLWQTILYAALSVNVAVVVVLVWAVLR